MFYLYTRLASKDIDICEIQQVSCIVVTSLASKLVPVAVSVDFDTLPQ